MCYIPSSFGPYCGYPSKQCPSADWSDINQFLQLHGQIELAGSCVLIYRSWFLFDPRANLNRMITENTIWCTFHLVTDFFLLPLSGIWFVTRTHCLTSLSQSSLLETWWECGYLEPFLTNLEGERCSFWDFLSWACQVLAVQWPLDSTSLPFYVQSPQ